MRFYSLNLTDASGASFVVSNQGFTRGAGPTFYSLYQRPFSSQLLPDPGALDIEFDIPVSQLGKPQGTFRIKVRGVGLQCLGQASNLAGAGFMLKAGMSAGLPLANPAQAGVIARGIVLQSWGNWEGTNMSLDMLVVPGVPGSTTDNVFERNLSFFWPAGSSLYDAIDAALQAALPEFRRQIFIDPNLTLPNDECGWYATPTAWASYLLGVTQPLGKKLLGFSYPGVEIVVTGDVIYVFDGTAGGPASILTQLEFTDLIGQPTWISATAVSFSTVLRADIGVGNKIRFPEGIVPPYALTSPAAAVPGGMVPARSKSIFQGDFLVREVHHFGHFREPSGDSWATAFVATAPPVSST
jgi:hypothetical protein